MTLLMTLMEKYDFDIKDHAGQRFYNDPEDPNYVCFDMIKKDGTPIQHARMKILGPGTTVDMMRHQLRQTIVDIMEPE